MRLSRLVAQLPQPPLSVSGSSDPDVSAVVHHGLRVTPGAAFVAVYHRGYAADRHEFVQQAIGRGAVAVVVSRPVEVPPGFPVVRVQDTAESFGWLAAALRGMPSQRLGVVGVTGTDGKTTTCTLTTAVLEAGGFATGMATTVASKATGDAAANAHHTSTPEADEIQALLEKTLAEGGTRAVLEATSHALDQGRLAGCEIDVAVVTRVTHEHLEYHGSPENYLEAKARLLDLARPNERHPKSVQVAKAAVLNVDDHSFATLAPRATIPLVPYGLGDRATLRAVDLAPREWGTRCRVQTPWGDGALDLPLPGEFNVYNALAAIGAGCTLGVELPDALDALARHQGVRGRMQRIDAGQPFTVVVDFAHTPDSLERVLRLLRAGHPGKIIVVFGSAGERDVQKRPWMGRIAAELADFAVFTDEDPRLEPSGKILNEIASGAIASGGREGATFLKVADRRMAIREALSRARSGDAVLLAGKGHETSIIGQLDGRLHTNQWDESATALAELGALGYRGR